VKERFDWPERSNQRRLLLARYLLSHPWVRGQLSILRAFARRAGHRIVGVFKENRLWRQE
jgi:hypothetical protein